MKGQGNHTWCILYISSPSIQAPLASFRYPHTCLPSDSMPPINLVMVALPGSIGGTPCTSTAYTSDIEVECVAPAGTGVTKSVLVDVSGQVSTANTAFSYAPPTVTSITPTKTATAGGHTITVTGVNLGVADTTPTGMELYPGCRVQLRCIIRFGTFVVV